MTRRIDENGDWTFGNHKANYLTLNNEILQNVKTRLKSFKSDWFLDSSKNIDWFRLLGSKQATQEIKTEVERVVRQTMGVVRVNRIDIDSVKDRAMTISLNLDTIYNKNLDEEFTL